jgi:hypothetical protein
MRRTILWAGSARIITVGVAVIVALMLWMAVTAPLNTKASAREPSTSHRTFKLTAPGVDLEQPDTLRLAAQLNNISPKAAFKVKINSIKLDSAPLRTSTPVPVGKIGAGRSAIVDANFDSSHLTQGKQYTLVMHGCYKVRQKPSKPSPNPPGPPPKPPSKSSGPSPNPPPSSHPPSSHKPSSCSAGARHKMKVKRVVDLPPAAPGSSSVKTGTVPAKKVTGAPYPAQPPSFEEDKVNGSRWTVPTGKPNPGTPTPTDTPIQKAPQNAPAPKNALATGAPPIVFKSNTGVGIKNGSTTAEPSGASGGGVVFVSANWFAAYLTDGGSTFKQLNPTTIFPSDAIGFCCDQVVQYVPSIDRFIWLLQGTDGYRLASASPADIIKSGGTAWTYWNLPETLFGQPDGTGLDYPDLSVGNNSLYTSWDVGFPTCPKCTSGFQVSRISLAGIKAGGTITIDYTHPEDALMAWGGHLMQNTGDEIFWAGHNSSSQMRVFSLKEGSNTYFWRDVGISSWANNTLTSTTPDKQDWLNFGNGFPKNAVIGSTRVGNQLWFAWNAGTDSNFKQPHVEMVTLDRNNNFNKTQQMQIWNNSYAFAYPYLATNACTNEVGLSFEYGGGGNYENHVVGFWGDFVAYITTGSNVGTTRFGDYVTLRQAPATQSDPGNLFAAFGYGLNSPPPPATGTQADIHYVLFGRPASSCNRGPR